MYQVKNSEEIGKLISKGRVENFVICLNPKELREDIPSGEIIDDCNTIVKLPIPDTPYEYFIDPEFCAAGDRIRYESTFFEKRRNMYLLAIGTFLEPNNDLFV